MKKETNKENRIKRHRRVRAKIIGSAECPRLAVFRSNKHIYVQLIDDSTGKTIAAVSDFGVKKKLKGMEVARELGKLIAEKAQEQKISAIVFDRGGYKYHGNVKALAEGAREQGLVF